MRMLDSWLVPVIAGGGAGLIETLLTYPLDYAKTKQQLEGDNRSSTYQTLKTARRKNGVFGLYRGLTAPLSSEVPRRALKFGANGFYQDNFELYTGIPSTSFFKSVFCGAAAGSTETLIHTPFERIKILVQSGVYSSPIAAFRGIIQTNGFTASLPQLYRGWTTYVIRQAVWNGAFFGFIAVGNDLANQFQKVRAIDKNTVNFAIGLVSGTIATILNNPLDVIKTRLQNQVTGKDRRLSFYTVSISILQNDGLYGFCRGLPARLYRSAPGHGILYMAFEGIKTRLNEWQR